MRIDRSEAGSAVLEMVILAPVLLLILALGIAGGRLALAHEQVDAAAGTAARAASVTRSPAGATAAATTAAQAALAGAGLSCQSESTTVDTTRFVPGGSVSVRITCIAQLGSLLPQQLVGTHAVSGASTAVIDTYRSVSG
jgi:Flp pilus assembly protein TadG